MRLRDFTLALLASLPLVLPSLALACEDGHWIDSVSSDGRIIILEDGSVWEVDSLDRIDSSLWLPMSEIVACDDKLINTDDDEVVDATRIR
jgi:hypothetical protein